MPKKNSNKKSIDNQFTEKQYIPDYMKPSFNGHLVQQRLTSECNAKQNYENYLKELYELDERSPYTLVWDDYSKTYSKVTWRSIWEERERKEQEENELRWEQTLQRIENMMLEKLEREKPWLFENNNIPPIEYLKLY